jgi:hypothetical protein
MEFTCECCHYTTTVKCNLAKHLSSKKHIIQKYKQTPAFKLAVSNAPALPEVVPKATALPEVVPNASALPEVVQNAPELVEAIPKGIFCKYCNKSFTFKQAMYRHIKNYCPGNKDHLNQLQIMTLKMETERKEFQLEINELQKQFEQQKNIFDKEFEKQQKIFNKQSEIQTKHIEYLTCILEMHRRL